MAGAAFKAEAEASGVDADGAGATQVSAACEEELLEASVDLAHPLEAVFFEAHDNVLNHKRVLYKLVPGTLFLFVLIRCP